MAPPSTAPAFPAPPPGVDLDAEFVNITPDRFTSVPKSSHRDGPHRLASLLALGVLTLYLSNKTGWKIPNAETLAKTWKEGADRIRAALADLERAGFLVRFRIQGERGRWVTRTFVSADPETLEPIRRYAAALEAAYAAAKVNKARTIDGGESSQVAPDGGFRDSVDRDSVDRDSVTGHLKDQETDLGDHQGDPPLPRDDAATAPAGDRSATGGSDLDEATRATLNDAAEAAAAARAGAKGWKPAQVRAAIRDALDGGHPPALVAERLAQIAADTARTTFPTRLRPMLDTEAAEAARKAAQVTVAPTPPWVEGPFKHLDRDAPRCRKHPGNPAQGCGGCKADQVAADPGNIPVQRLDGEVARQAAAAAIAAGRRNVKAKANAKARPVAAMDALAQVAAEVTAPAADPAPEPVGATT